MEESAETFLNVFFKKQDMIQLNRAEQRADTDMHKGETTIPSQKSGYHSVSKQQKEQNKGRQTHNQWTIIIPS